MTTVVDRPARLIPLLYLGTAHVALAFACFLAGWWPQAVAGFFYHSWMVGIVHLVTLGWITFSILGAIYIVGPVALRMSMPAQRGDYVAFAVAAVGVVGMIGHFWIEEFAGMAWSTGAVAGGIFFMSYRIVQRARTAGVPGAIKLHLTFACVNILIAATAGVLLGFDKAYHFLPGFVLANVFAHAHLAAIGWATMMVVGVAYRLLPMVFPSKMPTGRSLYASAILIETGVLGLFVTLLLRSAWATVFGALIVAGLIVFLGHVVWMARRPAPRPAAAPRIDFAVLHAAFSGISLVIAAGLGMSLLILPSTPKTLQAAAAYGVFGLVGFLAQIVVGMEQRLLPLFTWFWAYARSDFKVPPTPPLAMGDRTLQALGFLGWLAGVPLLADGMFRASGPLVAAGAWSLFAAVLLATLDTVFVLLHVRTDPAGGGSSA